VAAPPAGTPGEVSIAALNRQENRRERRHRPLREKLLQFLLRLGRREARSAIEAMVSAPPPELRQAAEELRAEAISKALITKADGDHAELRELLRLFGLRQIAAGARRAAGAEVFAPQLLTEASAAKPTKIQWFWEWDGQLDARVTDILETTKNEVRASVRTIITEAMGERPRPSMQEVSRRIRRQIHARDPKQRIHTFSPERAEIIARTELAQAENTGIVAGYAATGVKKVKWVAFNDGRSGDRHHERMNKHRAIKLGDDVFTLPGGATLRYPGDPMGPIGETINCRCTVVPVVPKRRRR